MIGTVLYIWMLENILLSSFSFKFSNDKSSPRILFHKWAIVGEKTNIASGRAEICKNRNFWCSNW